MAEKGKTKQFIYVCSPLKAKSRDPDEAREEVESNLNRAREACRTVSILGAVPIAPHLYCTQFLDDSVPDERKTGMDIGLEFMRSGLIDECWVFSEHISEGMLAEITLASDLDIPVRMICESAGVLGKLLEE
ncbi:MAG: hypothetical protein BACD_00177 [Bacteroides rodentium]